MTAPSDGSQICASCSTRGCETLLHACLAADFSDLGYGIVHHLIVPTYGLQHNWYPAEAEARIVGFVLSHLVRPPNDHDRQSIRAAADGSERVRARHPRHRHHLWNHGIDDIDHTSAEHYVATVRTWAASVATMLLSER